MKKAIFLSAALATALATVVRANSVTINGEVVRERNGSALGETVNVVSSPEDREGRDSKGKGVTMSPGGNYFAPVAEVGDRVTGLWVTCINASEVANPKYVPFLGRTTKPRIYIAEQLRLIPKGKPNFTKSEAQETIEALAMTYELHVSAELIDLSEAIKRLAKECGTVLSSINREPASPKTIAEVMWAVHDNILKKLRQTKALDGSWKLDETIAPKTRPDK